jgi:glycerophosphoryl diester phosphodiesterase
MWVLYVIRPVLVLLGLWLFLIAPGSSRGMEKFKKAKYAHRGLHGTVDADTYAAENSLTAFRRAVEHGFGIELDVHVTKDGEVVVFHDDTTDRVTGVSGRLKDFTLAELREMRLSGTEDTVPTLKEVLDLVDGKIPLLIEIKETGTDHSISEATAEVLKSYKGDFIVESFSPLAFGAFRKAFQRLPCGFLCDKLSLNKNQRALKFRLIQRQLLNVVARPAFIALCHKRAGLFPVPFIKWLWRTTTVAWTVKSPEDEKKAYENGFDTVIFEGYLPESVER